MEKTLAIPTGVVLAATLQRNQALTEENGRLRRQLARALGDQRTSRTRSSNNQPRSTRHHHVAGVSSRTLSPTRHGRSQPQPTRKLKITLDQRIATRFTIKPMDLAESATYLRHHLKLAGREDPLLADDAIARLHRVASGLPRALNNAATAALIAAAAAGKDLVDDACARKAVAELTRD